MFNIIYAVWIRRNHVRFKDKHMHWKPALNMIIAQTSLAGNITKEVEGTCRNSEFLKLSR
jgi:hypothetical protein